MCAERLIRADGGYTTLAVKVIIKKVTGMIARVRVIMPMIISERCNDYR